MITIKHIGNFNKTEKFLKRASMSQYLNIFERYGQEGVMALSANTPVESGKTASSWGYVVRHIKRGVAITWTNSNVVDGVKIAVILQYGHGTGNGGYVQGTDYINPALKPIFDKIMTDIWKEVTSL